MQSATDGSHTPFPTCTSTQTGSTLTFGHGSDGKSSKDTAKGMKCNIARAITSRHLAGIVSETIECCAGPDVSWKTSSKLVGGDSVVSCSIMAIEEAWRPGGPPIGIGDAFRIVESDGITFQVTIALFVQTKAF